jgi:hypothetical protein
MIQEFRSTLASFFSDCTAGMRKSMAEKTLKNTLIEIKEAAKEYERNKLPAGHEYYQLLYSRATEAVNQFCAEWGEQQATMLMKFPFLYMLEKKANPSVAQETSNTGYMVLGAAGVALAALGIGACLGFGTGVFDVVNHAIKGLFGA